MVMADVQVIAIIQAKEGSADPVRQALEALVGSTRSEAGCVSYDLHESTTAPGTFVTLERWRGQDDLDSHMKTEHVQQAFAAAGDHLGAAPAIHVLKPVVVG